MVSTSATVKHSYMGNLFASPTNIASLGHWAIARLQAEAREQLSLFLHEEAPDEAKDEVPFIGPRRDPRAVQIEEPDSVPLTRDRLNLSVGRYRGSYGKCNGTLCLDINQVHFEAQVTGSPAWSLRYRELKAMRKVSLLKYTYTDSVWLKIPAMDRLTGCLVFRWLALAQIQLMRTYSLSIWRTMSTEYPP
jgi:hypothetical protein